MKKNWNLNDGWGQDIVDSQDIISRQKTLECEYEFLQSAYDNAHDKEERDIYLKEIEKWKNDYEEELEGLNYISSIGSDLKNWEYGVILINDQYLEEYVKNFAYDISDISSKQYYQWPFNCIDWAKATEQFKVDCFSIEWDGEEYWFYGD